MCILVDVDRENQDLYIQIQTGPLLYKVYMVATTPGKICYRKEKRLLTQWLMYEIKSFDISLKQYTGITDVQIAGYL